MGERTSIRCKPECFLSLADARQDDRQADLDLMLCGVAVAHLPVVVLDRWKRKKELSEMIKED